jgi:hypothetical protein
LYGRLTRQPGVRGGVKLLLVDAPEWLTLKTDRIGQSGGQIILKVNENANSGDIANVILSGIAHIPKKKDDPNYNPVIRFLNVEEHRFAIDAIPIEVIN